MSILFYNLFDNYYVALYYVQYYFYSLILLSNQSNFFLLLLLFLLLGILTVLTPCFLSLLPIGLSYITSRNDSFNSIALFISGMLTSFLFVFIFIDTITVYISVNQLPFFSNFLILILGLDLMNVLDISKVYLSLNSLINISSQKNLLLQKYLTGLIIGLSVLPCNTSILFIFNFIIRNINNAVSLTIYFVVYLLGLIMPLVIIFIFKLYSLGIKYLSSVWYVFNSLLGFFLFTSSLFSLLKLIFN
uniref:Thiol:disulfide interchange protein n=1 Tax=Kapraunia schneideri TaxID=717899 RepID=A0A1Z1MRY1_9FLOR|nr:thiol:disulfide interchange protein [Kapraunia schneideri]ARW68843.1 thiol:disulfide interchange protein [Kapraunia schneideri]